MARTRTTYTSTPRDTYPRKDVHTALKALAVALVLAVAAGIAVGASWQRAQYAETGWHVAPCTMWAPTANPELPAHTVADACSTPDGEIHSPAAPQPAPSY